MKLRLYLADMIEPQANGKLAVLGLFTDLVIGLNVPPGSPDPTPEAAFGTDVVLMLTLTGLPVGAANGEVQLFAPGLDSMPVVRIKFPFRIPEAGAGVNIPVALRPLPIPALGTFTVEFRAGAVILRETFEVRVRIDPAAPPPILLSRSSSNEGDAAPDASLRQGSSAQ